MVRPILLGGAERELALLNVVAILALVLGVGLHPLTITVALVLATAGHGALVRLAKLDAHGWRVFARHMLYRDLYPAQAHPLARSPVIHSNAERA